MNEAVDATIITRLAVHARNQPQTTAFHVIRQGAEVQISYELLLRQASAYSKFLAEAGVELGDVVLICLKQGADIYGAYLGAMLLGAVPAFLAFPTPKQDPILYWHMHRILFEQSADRFVLTYAENRSDLLAALPAGTSVLTTPPEIPVDARPLPSILSGLRAEPEPTAVALVQFSSGTTGVRKGVALTHRQIALQMAGLAPAINARQGLRIASWAPLYHDLGLMTAFMMPIQFGGTVVSLDPFEWAANPHLLLEVMDRHRCTHAWMPNFAFNHLVRTRIGNEQYQLGHIEALINCGEACKRSTFDRFEAAFAIHGIRPQQLQTFYGMAEAVMAVTQSRLGQSPRTIRLDRQAVGQNRLVFSDASDAMALLSNGPPIAGIEVRIDGPEIGEIQVRGPFVFDGYLNAPELTSIAFDDDWYRTGDIGCIFDGEVYVVGRMKEMIIHHGRNYYAHDIEATVSEVAGIKAGRWVALGVWSEEIGSEEIALVAERESSPGVSDATIRADIRLAVTRQFNVAVSIVHLVDPGWLVKTTSGKISRKENLEKLLSERKPPK